MRCGWDGQTDSPPGCSTAGSGSPVRLGCGRLPLLGNLLQIGVFFTSKQAVCVGQWSCCSLAASGQHGLAMESRSIKVDNQTSLQGSSFSTVERYGDVNGREGPHPSRVGAFRGGVDGKDLPWLGQMADGQWGRTRDPLSDGWRGRSLRCKSRTLELTRFLCKWLL